MSGLSETGWTDKALGIAKIVFYSYDIAKGIVRRSENSQALLGLPDEGPAEQWHEIIYPEDGIHFDDAMKRLAPGAPHYEIEYRIVHAATGRRFWVLDRGEASFDDEGHLAAITGAVIDISARPNVERELSRAARLRSVVFEAARMAAWHLDAASGRFTCTDELLVLLDLGRHEFNGTLRDVEIAIHPADHEAWRIAHEAALTPGGRMEVEFRVVLRQGGFRWLLSRGEVVRRRDGVPLESYGVMIDITERKQAEEKVAQLAAIVASSEDAIVSKSLHGIVRSWNRGAENLFGYTAAEMIGESVSRIIPEANAHEEANILATIRRGDAIPPYESVRLHKSGRVIHVSIAVSPIRDSRGVVVGASTIARDVTERRRHLEQVKQNEARLRLALRSAQAGAWDYDIRKRELHWSPEMFALYGLDPRAEAPSRESLIGQIVPAHRARARREFSRALLRGGSFTLEFPIIRPDGTEIWTALAGDVIQDARGRPTSARGIDQDITERKTWEKRQAMLLRELSHRVKNSLAVIQSVARQTLRSGKDPKAFVEAFEGRIRSLAASHSLLTEADWSGARLEAIIRSQLQVLADDVHGQVKWRGPDVVLPAEAATQLGLVLHELAANALQHGALSVPDGVVEIVWKASHDRLRLMWRERGGPPIHQPPDHVGFGTSLILSSALKVTRKFDVAGLTCKLELAL